MPPQHCLMENVFLNYHYVAGMKWQNTSFQLWLTSFSRKQDSHRYTMLAIHKEALWLLQSFQEISLWLKR